MRLPLNRTQFRDALEKGLGRAILHARRFGLDQMQREVRRAVLRCLVYDPQCEWHRSDWLWKLLKAGRCDDKHRAEIINELAKSEDYRDAQQLSALTFHYARAGDVQAKRALYSAFNRFVGSDHHEIERELMLLDGLRGLEKVAKRIGKELADGGDAWMLHVESIWWNAKDVFGAGAARKSLSDGSRFARVYLARAREIEASNRAERRAWRARRAAGKDNRINWEKFRADLENPARSASPHFFSKHATAQELRSTYKALSNERRPLQSAKLLHVFVRRRPPAWGPFLLRFARSSDDSVQHFAWEVLSHFRRPEVRRLALAAARRKRAVENGSLCLFKKNYHRGDRDIILAAIERDWKGREDAHCVGMTLIDIAEGNSDRSLAPVFVAGYGLTPCSVCRKNLFKKLVSMRAAPEWMSLECTEDANKDIRSLARKTGK